MTKEPTADKDSSREKDPKKTPSLLERMVQQGMEETTERARGDLRARRELESTVLGVDPDASLEEREKARRDLAQELGLEPDAASGSRVDRVAQRTEEEAIDRGSDEFRARQAMAEALGLEEPDTAAAPASLKEPDAAPATAGAAGSLVDRVAQRTEEEAIDRGSDEFRARQGLSGTLGLAPDTAPESPSLKKKRKRKKKKGE